MNQVNLHNRKLAFGASRPHQSTLIATKKILLKLIWGKKQIKAKEVMGILRLQYSPVPVHFLPTYRLLKDSALCTVRIIAATTAAEDLIKDYGQCCCCMQSTSYAPSPPVSSATSPARFTQPVLNFNAALHSVAHLRNEGRGAARPTDRRD